MLERYIKKPVLLFTIISTFILICALIAAFVVISPYDTADEWPRSVYIKNGDSLGIIAAKLEKQQIIRSDKLFKWFSLLLGKNSRYKKGEYQFDQPVSAFELARILEAGKTKLFSITLPEGLRMTEVFSVLNKKSYENQGIYDRYVFDKTFIDSLKLPIDVLSLEGFLFPETYKFTKDTSEQMILRTMVNTFLKKVPPDYHAKASNVNLSYYEAVTLASIIEKETSIANERRLIASVFHNRLKKKMKLQTDPTVIYGIKNFNGNLTRKQLRTPTPYNTYTNHGLPPTPIANPGLASLMAAVDPADTEYLFFVAKGDGTHIFSTNYKEHRKAVAKYQKRRSKSYRSY